MRSIFGEHTESRKMGKNKCLWSRHMQTLTRAYTQTNRAAYFQATSDRPVYVSLLKLTFKVVPFNVKAICHARKSKAKIRLATMARQYNGNTSHNHKYQPRRLPATARLALFECERHLMLASVFVCLPLVSPLGGFVIHLANAF